MDIELAAKQLSELGHTTRLKVFRFLTRSGRRGVQVGKVQDALKVPASTLSHHINRLVSVGLVVQHREGRTLYCIPQFDEFDKLVAFIQDECCQDLCKKDE